MLKKISILVLTTVFLLLIVGCSSSNSTNPSSGTNAGNNSDQGSDQANSDGWVPEGSLEFIASYSPGGGHDVMLRTIAKIAAEENIIENPIVVVNKPGGSGAVGMAYTASKQGETNYIMAVTSSFLTTPLQGGMDISYKDLTPIARLGLDPYVLIAKTGSGIDSFEDLLQVAQERDLTFGGTAIGSGEHMLLMELSEAAQMNMEYVPFEGNGEVITALLGKHIDLTANNLNAALEYINNGDMIPLAVSTPERLSILPDTPTLKELGYDIDWVLFRGIYGPPNMPQEAVKWYEEKFKLLSENPTWKEEYLDKYMIENGILTGQEFEAYLDELNLIYEENLRKLGIIE